MHPGAAVGYRYAPMNSGVAPEVVELAKAGQALKAMRLYRELTGASSEQARAIVMGL